MKNKNIQNSIFYKFNEHDIVYAFKMIGSNNRMNILRTIYKNPGITLDNLSKIINLDFKNTSFHTRKLYQSKLLVKKKDGIYLRHYLSIYGKQALKAFDDFLNVNLK
jgi:predicted transcriptional regulator